LDFDEHACEVEVEMDCAFSSAEKVTLTRTRTGTPTEADGDLWQGDAWEVIRHGKSGSRTRRYRVVCGRAHLGKGPARANAHLPDEVENVFSHHYRMETESVTLNDGCVYDAEVMEICSHVWAGNATVRN
jgi:hypothetical protein